MIELYDHQLKAIEKMKNGCILCGGVGTGKSRTALAYYYIYDCQGSLVINSKGSLGEMKTPRDLYIITTAKKRDSEEWKWECYPFGLTTDPDDNINHIRVTIDSWNNIKKYSNVFGAFFIFDEQRVCGSGAWVKAFLNISRKNNWILLSATPGDTWSDYIPVFIANGFYRNKTDFNEQHVIFSRFAKYPKIDRFINTGILIKHRNDILIMMKYNKLTNPIHQSVMVSYDKQLYLNVWRDRWDPYDSCPVQETGKLFYLMRKVVNSDRSRLEALSHILEEKTSAIIFYNFTYELLMMRELLDSYKIQYAEWNGEKHEPVPVGSRWVYMVQYSAGCEGWNCITTDTIIFYSQNYSYRMTTQAEGRIDRLNTPFKDLYYFHFKSNAPIDLAIARALKNKKNFNEKSFIGC